MTRLKNTAAFLFGHSTEPLYIVRNKSSVKQGVLFIQSSGEKKCKRNIADRVDLTYGSQKGLRAGENGEIIRNELDGDRFKKDHQNQTTETRKIPQRAETADKKKRSDPTMRQLIRQAMIAGDNGSKSEPHGAGDASDN